MLLKKIISIFVIYTFFIFVYSRFGVNLGKDYIWDCFEPGCVIVKDSRMIIYGDIDELSLNEKFIFGKVNKPNNWMIENENGHNIAGYFILNKDNNVIQIKLSPKEFIQKCQELGIDSHTTLKYKSPFWVVYNPYYWYIIMMNKFD